MIKTAAPTLVAAVLVVGLTAGCEVEDSTAKDKHPYSSTGNGPQSAKSAPKPKKAQSGPHLSAAQENAVGKAQDYLDFSAFSKSGLIKQLKYEGFSTKDATFAANHIRVNWNAQAAKKARDYLGMSSFSRQGLINQLRYEGFTAAQAAYGATQAGL